MAYSHINWVRDHSKTTGAVRLLLFAIASRTNKYGVAFPSRGCLARDTKMSERNVRRALKDIPRNELEIIKGGSPKGGKREVTKYRILMDRRNSPTGDNTTPVRPPPTGDNTTPVAHTMTGDKLSDDRTQVVPRTGDKSGQRPDSYCPPNRLLTDQLTEANTRARARNGSSTSSAPVTQSQPAFVLSQADLAELRSEFKRLGEIERFIPEAAKKCAKDHPNGSPMRKEYFRRYLANLESDLARLD